ncbi:MAG TPA: hypothetical protein VIN61_01655 [Gammaproteobacteria bacterium]
MARSSTEHTWQFFRAGDFEQVALTSGADLLALDRLDQKLWAALGCPVDGLHFDRRTLELIDTDGDGRIRASELIAAVKWAASLLKNVDDLMSPADALPLDAIDDSTPAGAAMLAAARHVLEQLGLRDADRLSPEQTADARSRFAQMPFNGDGIVTHATVGDDADAKALLDDVIACVGADTDASGNPGISGEKLEQFMSQAAALSELLAEGERDPAIRPLGDGTAAAAGAVAAVRAKVTDYFTRCRLAEFDPRAAAALNRTEGEYAAIAAADLEPTAAAIAALPLARIEPGKPLDLVAGLNPAWQEKIEALRTAAVVPLLGERTELTHDDWHTIQAKLAPYERWSAAVAASPLAKLGAERLQAILQGDAAATLRTLIDRDRAESGTAAAIDEVDRLVRYYRHLRLLCENFVNFKHFYSGESKAIFQAGTLYIDQRSCELTLFVDDAAKNAPMVAMAGTYLLYCDCTRRATGEKRQIVAAVTNGDSDNLMVGRNGVFYDRDGRDWDATITKIVDNPISLRQAFWAPYKKLVRLVEEQVAKRAAAADAAASQRLETAATTVAHIDQTKPPEGPKKIDVGTVAALGVAFGALATATAAIAGYASGLMQLPFWQLCVAIGVLLLIVSGPSVLIAWLKLRKRNLGPLLDANGWAVNARARLNVPFGASLTGIAQLPRGAKVALGDRFGQRPAAWPKLVGAVVAIGFVYSLLNDFGVIRWLTDGRLGDEPGRRPGLEVLLTPAGDENVPPADGGG